MQHYFGIVILASQYEDFDAAYYIWFNRREDKWAGVLAPLCESTDSMSIMRWYAVETVASPECMACSDVLGGDLSDTLFGKA